MIKEIENNARTGLNIHIRPETTDEYSEVNELIYKAFTESYGAKEGTAMSERFSNERSKDTFIPELSLVALLENGKIVGQVALYQTDIITNEGRNTQLVLSQSAVLPEYRMNGIMRQLITFALDKAKEMGYVAIFLGGPAHLYEKFGFEPSYKYGIHHEKSGEVEGYAEGYMVHVLIPNALDGITGTTSYYGG
ncbi:MAG: N-acetyltransferase [Defluviitaleaceae bacterium]|nr:N-acetyltransferase [Defluviitaleaceae bacterium]